MTVNLILILRLALYVQFSLGIGRFFGLIPGRGLWDVHRALGVVIVLLALFAFRPKRNIPQTGLRWIAQFVAILPLVAGLLLLFNLIGGVPAVLLHMALGILTIGLIEGAAAEARRSQL